MYFVKSRAEPTSDCNGFHAICYLFFYRSPPQHEVLQACQKLPRRRPQVHSSTYLTVPKNFAGISVPIKNTNFVFEFPVRHWSASPTRPRVLGYVSSSPSCFLASSKPENIGLVFLQ